jgi:hypothetical protein
MKTSLILIYCLIPVLLCGQCAPRINPETGLLDCTGGQAGPAGPAGPAGGLQDSGGTGIVKRTTLNTTVVAVGADIPNLATSQITSGTFVDARIASSNVTQHQALLAIAATQLTGSILPARMPAFTGDVTTTAGAVATTLATVNSSSGICGDATHACAVTTNPKGLVTGQSAPLITATTGTTLPGTCTPGQLFEETTFYELLFCNPDGIWERVVKLISNAGNPNTLVPFACDSIEEVGRFAKDTTATSGATSLYGCASNGVGAFSWQAVATGTSGGSGASTQIELTDLRVTTNGSTTISVPAGAMPRFGQTVCADYTGGNVVMSSGTATVYISVANDCTVQATSTALFGTPTNITTATGTQFPVNHVPLAHCSYPTIVCTDDRRAFSTLPILAGANISVTSSAAGYTIASVAGGVGGTKVPVTQTYAGAGYGAQPTVAAGWILPQTAGATDPTIGTLSNGGQESIGIMFENGDVTAAELVSQIPAAWDGSAMTLTAYIGTADYGPAVGTLNVYYMCLADATLSATSYTATTALSGSLGNGSAYMTYRLGSTYALAGCTAGSELHLRFIRDTGDAFPQTFILKNVSMSWNLTVI